VLVRLESSLKRKAKSWLEAGVLGATWVREKDVGIVLKSFKDVVSGVRQMLEPARLAEYRKNVAAQNNRAIFEILEILATLLGQSPQSTMRGAEIVRASASID